LVEIEIYLGRMEQQRRIDVLPDETCVELDLAYKLASQSLD
jgi:hypothetical protein